MLQEQQENLKVVLDLIQEVGKMAKGYMKTGLMDEEKYTKRGLSEEKKYFKALQTEGKTAKKMVKGL